MLHRCLVRLFLIWDHYCMHTGIECSINANRRILNCDTGACFGRNPFGRGQENFWRRFAVGYLVTADDHIEMFKNTGF